jgi:hypothetical protein
MITTIEQVKKHIEDHYYGSLEFPIEVTTSSSGEFVELRNEYDHELIELPISEQDLDYAIYGIEQNAIEFSQD